MSKPYGYQDPDHLDHHRGLPGCPLAGAGITNWSQDYNPGPLRESGVIPTARPSPLLGEEFSLDCIGTYEIKLACLLVPTILYFLKQLLICLRFSFPTLKDVATLWQMIKAQTLSCPIPLSRHYLCSAGFCFPRPFETKQNSQIFILLCPFLPNTLCLCSSPHFPLACFYRCLTLVLNTEGCLFFSKGCPFNVGSPILKQFHVRYLFGFH